LDAEENTQDQNVSVFVLAEQDHELFGKACYAKHVVAFLVFENSADGFRLLCCQVEKSLQVDAAVGVILARENSDETLGGELAVQKIGLVFDGEKRFEFELLANFFGGFIHQDLSVFQDDDGVDEAFQITNLMGGKDKAAIVGDGFGHQFAELGFGRNVQAVGWFVKNHDAALCGECEANAHFFPLTEGHAF
jgi:hypothetical protein